MGLPSDSVQVRRRGDGCGNGGQHGFTYIGLMIAVAVTGVFLAAAGELWQLAAKREKERELLFAGHQFRQALALYYAHSPARTSRYPARLEDLLKDPRMPATQRYLRRIYADPMTGSTQWGLVRGAGGEIFGVYSLSPEAPLKKGNFIRADKAFDGAEKYSDWVFMHAPSHYAPPPAGKGP